MNSKTSRNSENKKNNMIMPLQISFPMRDSLSHKSGFDIGVSMSKKTYNHLNPLFGTLTLEAQVVGL